MHFGCQPSRESHLNEFQNFHSLAFLVSAGLTCAIIMLNDIQVTHGMVRHAPLWFKDSPQRRRTSVWPSLKSVSATFWQGRISDKLIFSLSHDVKITVKACYIHACHMSVKYK